MVEIEIFSYNIVGSELDMEVFLNHLLEILITIVSSCLLILYRFIRRTIRTIEVTRNSIMVIIKNIIIDKYYYFKNKNCITMEEKEYINNLYEEYHRLGGDSIIDSIIDEINELEVTRSCN